MKNLKIKNLKIKNPKIKNPKIKNPKIKNPKLKNVKVKNVLRCRVWASVLKIAKIIPIFKTGNQSFFTNYRPVSLLTNFSKLFEKVMQIRLTLFIEQCEILYRFQFGFRSNHSTMHSLVSLTNNVATAIDRNQIAAGVFIDLSTAFDTLDHEILFTKLQHYGIRGVALQWIKSYFCNREQFVQYNETCSSMEK
jgi:hypothetical protein